MNHDPEPRVDASDSGGVEVRLDAFLREVRKGLWAVGPRRRKEIIRTLRADLLDTFEAEGLISRKAADSYLAGQGAPGVVARRLQACELEQAFWRVLAALLPLIFLIAWILVLRDLEWTGPSRRIMEEVFWYGALVYSLFCFRIVWSHHRPWRRMLSGAAAGFLLGGIWRFTLHGGKAILAFGTTEQFLYWFIRDAGMWMVIAALLGLVFEEIAGGTKRLWSLGAHSLAGAVILALYLYVIFPLVPPPRVWVLAPARPGSCAAASVKAARPTHLRRPQMDFMLKYILEMIGMQATLVAGYLAYRKASVHRLFRITHDPGIPGSA